MENRSSYYIVDMYINGHSFDDIWAATGGYAKIATVVSVDIPKLVQRKTEQKVRFQAVSVEEAQKLLADEMKELNDFRSQIYTPCKEVLDCRLVAKRISTLFK